MWANRSGRSPKMSDVSESLRSLTKNEQPWAIRSGRSPKMSDHERNPQFALQKWVKVRIPRFFEQIAHSLIFLQKTSDSLRKPMSEFPTLIINVQKIGLYSRNHRTGGEIAAALRWAIKKLSPVALSLIIGSYSYLNFHRISNFRN